MTDLLQLPWVQRVLFGAGGLLLGLLVERLVVVRARQFAERTRFKWDDLLVKSLQGLPTVFLGAGGVYLALTVGEVDPLLLSTVRSILTVLVIGSVASRDSLFSFFLLKLLHSTYHPRRNSRHTRFHLCSMAPAKPQTPPMGSLGCHYSHCRPFY